MEKIGEDNDQREKYLKKIEELESSVADSARRLCSRILQYEGKAFIDPWQVRTLWLLYFDISKGL